MAFHRHYLLYRGGMKTKKANYIFFAGVTALLTIGDDSISVTLATSRLNTKNRTMASISLP